MLEKVYMIPPKSRSPLPAVDINGFFNLVSQALGLYIETVGKPEVGVPVFIEEYAQQKITDELQANDLITFRVVNSEMAPTTEGGLIPKRPLLREKKVHPTKGAGYEISVFGWWERVEVEFTLISRSNANGNFLAEWFHVFLMKYAQVYQYFQGRGIENFEFVGRKDDPVDHTTGQEMYLRRLNYKFRLNRLFATESRLLTSVDLGVGIGDQVDTVKVNK